MQNKPGIISFTISFILFLSLIYQKQIFTPFVRLICSPSSECIGEGLLTYGIVVILIIIGFIVSGWLAIVSLVEKKAKGIYAIYTILSILLLLFALFFVGAVVL
ncbi:MAG: hypothetical protein A3G45_02980 [Candidatus Staskawiczbacteria bacterium RIFCSPLOWO2_12_FULL_37_15]|uniref:Uncharacterized protein n=1 Tax=Candidatus Staskawiczbacteria bacterium RIFCSPLOWO2_12_FULL_37_15 TaxID=1802218 RepID=A0A1G2INE4_9BACT|nr:MAG: hypothetical protein US35_C0028G0005 [Parcubacteria group bacterium GW2011_GWA2_37_10]OGZ76424.1 MAG: hypothetical protein A3G45_02980 [Candidatus Staskawiczbacteria bacterium RIFCSPLOWO2_12_FULL_37_15]